MANAAAKKQANANSASLKALHTRSAVTYGIVLLINLLRSQLTFRLVLFMLPGLAVEYFLDKTGRPKFRNGQLASSGSNLNGSGVNEYLHDFIYLTWISSVLSLMLGLRAFLLLFLTPVFLAYKGISIIKSFRSAFSPPAANPNAQ